MNDVEQPTAETDAEKSPTAASPDTASDDDVGADSRRDGSVAEEKDGARGVSGARWLMAKVSSGRFALIVLVLVVTATAVVFGVKWHAAQSELDDVHAAQSRTAAATALAKDYTLRSLTYDYRDMNAFFDGVAKDATDSLKEEYRKARPDLQSLMSTAQVVASGNVVASSVLSSTDDRFEVAVTALQKTKNLQQPEEQIVPNILKVVIVRHGDGWLVDKYSAM